MKAFIRSRVGSSNVGGNNSNGNVSGSGRGNNDGGGSGSGKRIRSQYLLHGVYRRDGKGG